MRAALAKFGFIHRRLWQRDGRYKVALLFGPAALVGLVTAIVLKVALDALVGLIGHSPTPAWATPVQRPDMWNANDDPVHSLQPASPLPPMTANGELSTYVPGWRAAINELEISQTLNIGIKREPISGFTYDGATIDMARLLAEGPKSSPFAGLGSAFLVVKTAGIYALSLNFERPAGQTANCLLRLGFGPKRVVSEVELSMVGDVSKTFDPVKFDLQPGLYPIGWAFGCWHEHDEVGPGRMTVLVSHPDEPQPRTARPDEIVHQRTASH
jgi:hypothetical protein